MTLIPQLQNLTADTLERDRFASHGIKAGISGKQSDWFDKLTPGPITFGHDEPGSKTFEGHQQGVVQVDSKQKESTPWELQCRLLVNAYEIFWEDIQK